MSTPGRPRLLDETKQSEVCALVTAGCALADAARYVGCSARTIRREAERIPEFGKRLRAASARSQLRALEAMRNAASTHWRAAAWLLERTNPRRFARPNMKTYRADEVRTVLDDVIQSAVEDIKNPRIRERVTRRLSAAARRASRALEHARDRNPRRREPQQQSPLADSQMDAGMQSLLATLDRERAEAFNHIFGNGQNPKDFD